MIKGLRVLVVDDSMVFRETLVRELGRYLPAFSIIDKAEDPFAARDKILAFHPDVMLLDVEMPKMDGIEFLRRLLAQYPLPTVVMSADPEYCAMALAAGACDFVSKPSGGRTMDSAFISDVAMRLKVASQRQLHIMPYDWGDGHTSQTVNSSESETSDSGAFGASPAQTQKLMQSSEASVASSNVKSINDVTAMYLARVAAKAESASVITSGIKVTPGSVFNAPPPPKPERAPSRVTVKDAAKPEADAPSDIPGELPPPAVTSKKKGGSKKKTLIAIGASTGGTVALTKVIAGLRPPLPPIVVVQHIPPNFSRLFAERLDEESALHVKEAVDGDRVEKNHVYIAPGGKHMRLKSTIMGLRLECAPGKPVNSVCPAVDVLFYTVAEIVGDEAIGVILTGMGRDGADGLLKMRQAGAATLGQDERTCVVYGMPRAAWEVGAVQRQMAIDAIAGSITALAMGKSSD